jgi:hypothetical protein
MKKSLLFVAVLFIFFNSFSQQGKREYSGFFDSYYYKGKHNLNFTGNFGLSFYQGDLCSVCLKPDISFAVGANYKVWPRTMFGAELRYLKLSGKDNVTTRNLAFNTSGIEFIAYGRFLLIDDIVRVAADRTRPPKLVKPYIMAGFGFYNYSPKSYFTKTPPETDTAFYYNENKGGGMVAVIPVGFGISWRISNRVSLLTELSYRFTFTDYLDQVSQRGNPKRNDGYAILDFKLQFSPWAAKKKKVAPTTPPQKYEGPKGTETWKNKKKEEPVRKNNNYYEETPTEEQPSEGETPTEENGEEQQQEEQKQEETPSDELK